MGLASLWCMVALNTATILALRSRSEKRRVHFITTVEIHPHCADLHKGGEQSAEGASLAAEASPWVI
jgi:hypothetical protein